MQIDPVTLITVVSGVVASITAVWAAIRKIVLARAIRQESFKNQILEQAKLEAERVKEELESKIKSLEEEFREQKASVGRDLAHMQESYSGSVAVLGEKIEILREEIRAAQANLMGLLVKLIDKN